MVIARFNEARHAVPQQFHGGKERTDIHVFFRHRAFVREHVLEQKGTDLLGTHHGEVLSGDLKGTVAANTVDFRTSHKYEGTHLSYEFTGTVNGDTMEGKVNLGEYGEAKWTAKRHKYA